MVTRVITAKYSNRRRLAQLGPIRSSLGHSVLPSNPVPALRPPRLSWIGAEESTAEGAEDCLSATNAQLPDSRRRDAPNVTRVYKNEGRLNHGSRSQGFPVLLSGVDYFIKHRIVLKHSAEPLPPRLFSSGFLHSRSKLSNLLFQGFDSLFDSCRGHSK